MNQNQNNFILMAALGLALSNVPNTQAAESLSPEALRVLSKKNRKLEAPPKALKASEANVDLRYASGQRRLSANDSQSDNLELETIPVTNPSDYIQKPGTGMSFDYSGRRSSKLDRVFGLGFVSAGAYGVFGAEMDFALMQDWTFGFGLGTGMDYSSWSAHSRYLFRKAALTPFVELGYANWHLGKVSERNQNLVPSSLAKRFFSKNGAAPTGDETAHIIYPGFGINYLLNTGLSLIAQAQYMIHLGDFSGGLTGSAGIYYYF